MSAAAIGDMLDPSSVPADVRQRGGGWIGNRDVCDGAHKDGTVGWKLTEIRR